GEARTVDRRRVSRKRAGVGFRAPPAGTRAPSGTGQDGDGPGRRLWAAAPLHHQHARLADGVGDVPLALGDDRGVAGPQPAAALPAFGAVVHVDLAIEHDEDFLAVVDVPLEE